MVMFWRMILVLFIARMLGQYQVNASNVLIHVAVVQAQVSMIILVLVAILLIIITMKILVKMAVV
jgi:hypothetical protein